MVMKTLMVMIRNQMGAEKHGQWKSSITVKQESRKITGDMNMYSEVSPFTVLAFRHFCVQSAFQISRY